MKPQHVYIENGKATICGIPDADHNCDAMGCSSLEHVLCRTTFEQAPRPPAEWMMVPKMPTDEMLQAARNNDNLLTPAAALTNYLAMLAAAPKDIK